MSNMSNKEAIEMMQRSMHEIQDLRARVATLAPKADAYDKLAIVLELLPKPSVGYGEDLVWRFQKRIKELQEVPADAKPL